ncbi:cell wall-binding repeat-containing protein [Clostridium coskatii]|uniref:N-acetylmuramoyl-L-alanine amidase LytC n=1 Tax=Clostridium coskatii TaxID=1705578 RepID=A0A170NNR4_9CLOT|nr:cell wall-binding repeat-containing protein [Clostridium coskatii]OAA94181.1 N-acetylmuramoyl-L-alanine amidase LytC precursor [Clostridium coskatii]OBR95549.1 N-acetylmuramoyl-L-alanine amidase LytC precursor [Clostridium coskatii]
MLRRNKIISKLILGVFLASSTVFSAGQNVFAASGRLWGQDRYATSTAVSENSWASSDYVVLASGEGYADALCAAPVAKKYNAPILLTGSKELNEGVKSEITRLKATHVIEIGGEASISSDIENELKSMKLNVQRLGGQNRFETSVVVANSLENVTKVVVTSGYGFADALSIAPIASNQGMPILLTGKDSLSDAVQNYINQNKDSIKNSYVIGGQGVISDSAISGLPTVARISGQNRFDTNVKVLSYFKGSIDFDNLYVVKADGPTGNEFADALSGSAAAAKTSSPIILTYNTLYSGMEDFIKSNVPKTASVTAIGGTGAVPDSLVSIVEQTVSGIIIQNPSTPGGGSSSGGSSSSDDANLSSVLSKLKSMDTSKLDNNQKTIVSDIITALDKYEADSNYNLNADAQNVKQLYNNLTHDEKSSLKTTVVNAGVSISEGITLASKFGLY